MFKKMSLGAKLGVGFGVVVIISIIIGTIAVLNMKSVQQTTTLLVRENMPEVEISTTMERSALQTMYQMRGFVYSYDEKFLEEGKKNIADIRKSLQEAKTKGASSTRLVKLREAAEQSEAAINEYERMADETASQIRLMQDTLKKLIPVGERYVNSANNTLSVQNDLIQKELDSGNQNAQIKNALKIVTTGNEVLTLAFMTRKAVWESMARRDVGIMEEAIKNLESVEEKLNAMKSLTQDDSVIKDIETIRSAKDDYATGMKALIAAMNKLDELNKARGVVAQSVLDLAKSTALLGMSDTSKASTGAAAALASSAVIVIIGLIIGALMAIALAWVITRGITVPIDKIVNNLNDGSDQTASAAGQVSSASQQLSQGATEQAASLQETSSSLDQMSSMTKQNADNASKANQLAQEARSSAEQGNQAMSEMQSAMTAINESSDKISKIIKSIEEIAFQTNLLALNAAVEAARAGEHGKGFAVVAEEVRNLARRSAEAAKDTAGLIEDSIVKVKGGNEITKKAGETLKSITDNAKKVADIVSEIAAASKEQADGIGQVTNAVSQMDQVTQQNASAAEESASASEELASQADSLRSMVQDLQEVVRGVSNNGLVAAQSVNSLNNRRKALHHDIRVAHLDTKKKVSGSAGASKGPKVIKPEEVIPLDDDETLKKF